ncbi:Uncharacterised protein [Buttiauxella agrestis]|uniref:Uncharacterized protein n=1 Tax=Buttiauxella agrestis TaxID=82977 RepID=A0A381C872_9ENTR|nr:hypothetical protein [Buttiauxella agrestis]SUW64032.1 Uncharacterised protein [Buttiauxella agrestis]
MKKLILTVVLALVSTATFAQLTMTPTINNSASGNSSSSSKQTITAQGTSDLLGSDTVAGIGTSDTVAGLSGSDSQTINPTSTSSPMPAFGHTGNLRQPGSIRH